MAAAIKATTTVSSKGQVVLPKAVREQAGFHPGAKLIVEATPGQVTFRAETPLTPTTVDEVFGMLKYDGPPATIQEMNEAVDEYFRTRWGREYDDRD